MEKYIQFINEFLEWNKKSTSASSWDYSTSATSWYKSTSATSWNKSTSTSSWNYSTSATSWYKSTIIVNWTNNVWVANWYWVKWKWKIWNYICLTEYDEDYNNVINCKVVKIDWKKIKEDTFYVLKNWKFVEFKD